MSVGSAASAPTDAELGEFQFRIGERTISVLCRRALVSWVDEQVYLGSDEAKQYGMVLWPAAIALALELSHRAESFQGARILELGAGVGLPGIVAAAVGAHVVQTDRDAHALALCERNTLRNGVTTERRLADWGAWPITERFDWIIGSDILYRTSLHSQLLQIFDAARAPRGTLLLADPLRVASVRLLEQMERDGWSVSMTRWTVGEGEFSRTIGVLQLAR